MKRRVFVRGIGCVSAFGRSWPSTSEALAAGRVAIAPVEHFDFRGFPSQVAAAVRDDGAQPDRRRAMAFSAVEEAWLASGLSVDPVRLGVFLGAESGRASLEVVLRLSRAAGPGPGFDYDGFRRAALGLGDRMDATAVSPAAVSSALAAKFGALGPCETISLACSSGAAALVEATRAIRAGEIDAAIAGGVGADVDPMMLAGFGLLGALSSRGVSRPFDAHRDGFVVGEGAAIVVLSAERGAASVELAGVGRSLDAHHLTAPDPGGEGAVLAMSRALRDAGLDSVGYVQAHGTSTPLNDEVEAVALRRVFGARLADARVGSVKGALGHWIAGAGALGFLCAVHSVARGELLPTAGLTVPDPRCELPHVAGLAARASVDAALCNAFAFGGANSCLVVRRA